MSDWTPQIVKIEKVEKHPDADALDICTVLGDYPVITKRNEYQIDDLAGYIPIDSIVPDTNYFYFSHSITITWQGYNPLQLI